MKRTGWAQGLYEESSTQKEFLGTKRPTPDGRVFQYQRAGAVALAAGIPTSAPAIVANHMNVSCTAAAIGDTVVQVISASAAFTEDQYKHGYLQVNDGTGQGYNYLVQSNTAGTTTTVVLAEAIRVALVASATSEVSMIYNPCTGVIVSATTLLFAGVPPIAVTALYYFWNQIEGVVCALNTNATAIGTEVATGTGIFVIATNYTTACVGTCYAAAGVTDEYKPVYLTGR